MNSPTPLLVALTLLGSFGLAGVAPPQAQAYINAGFRSARAEREYEEYGHKVRVKLGPYDEAIQRDPKDPVAYYQRARAWEQLDLEPYSGPWPDNQREDRWDRTVQALHDYNQAIALDPSFTRAYWRRANLLLSSGQTRRGLEGLRQVIRLEPKSALAEKARALLREYEEDEEPNTSPPVGGEAQGPGVGPGSTMPPAPDR